MPTIHRLPDHLINQIAAGEAVERPSSVVKELIENSLDAGAGSIDIGVWQGGRRRIRVTDDGCGMAPQDARLALERHATSKIAAAEDLAAIRTLGFRGEALPAIASVSRLTLCTAAAEGDGFRLEVEGGAVRAAGPEAHPVGTTVDVRDLFYNTPARAKFLRTVATEAARVVEAVQAAALARPEVRFRLRHDDREILAAPPAADGRERVQQIFGAGMTAALIPVACGQPPLRASGYVSRPAFSRSGRSGWFLFVNGRVVADRVLSHAAAEACRPRFPRDRWPALFLFLEIPHAEVDVNVHPQKREVRYRTPGAVHDLVRRGLEEALGGGPVQEIGGARSAQALAGAVADAAEASLASAGFRSPSPRPGWGLAEAPPGRGEVRLPGPARRALGQLRDTYILVEDGDGLLLVDQHAAHERLLYDRLRRELRQGPAARQALLFPVTVEVSPAEAERLAPLLGGIDRLGFAVEPFGRQAFLVREVPALMAGGDAAAALRDLAGGQEPAVDLEHRVAALAACHGSVRAGMRLESGRLQRIVDDLFGGGHALTCPHGRPVTLRYPLREIERAFLRP